MIDAKTDQVTILEDALVEAIRALQQAALMLELMHSDHHGRVARDAAYRAWDATVRASQAGLR